MLRVLLAHNFYQQPGGEDVVFAGEERLLREHGHHVATFTVHNDLIKDMSRWAVARRTVWSSEVYGRVRQVIVEEGIELVHCHNTFPLLSPAIYGAANTEGVAVVQTVHNFRLLCANGLLFRDGRPCEDCIGRTPPWPAVWHACYRSSRAGSAVVAGMLTLHRWRGTWRRSVDAYIALTEFARRKLVQGGVPADRIWIKPNFLARDPGRGTGDGAYALYVGRLSPEKGIHVLLDAWRALNGRVPLKIVGDGPMAAEAQAASQEVAGVEWLGRKSPAAVRQLMQHARLLVVPSTWYEALPMVILEAFAAGLPVVASDIGSLRSVVAEGVAGLRFEPGNALALAQAVMRLVDEDGLAGRLAVGARAAYEAHYTAERSYRVLMKIYRTVARSRSGSERVGPFPSDTKANP